MQSNKTTENAGNRWIHHLYLNTKLPQTLLVIQTWNVYEKHWKTRVKHKTDEHDKAKKKNEIKISQIT